MTCTRGSSPNSVVKQDSAMGKTATKLFFFFLKMWLKERNLKDMSHHFEVCIKQVK